jgi:hypothetical protein
VIWRGSPNGGAAVQGFRVETLNPKTLKPKETLNPKPLNAVYPQLATAWFHQLSSLSNEEKPVSTFPFKTQLVRSTQRVADVALRPDAALRTGAGLGERRRA